MEGKGEGFEGYTWAEWRAGVRDQRGDLAVFDWSFLEDAWRGFGEGVGRG